MKRCRITSIEIYISVSYQFGLAHPRFRTFYSGVCTAPASKIASPSLANIGTVGRLQLRFGMIGAGRFPQ